MPVQRKGYLLTNGSGCYIANREERNEIEELIALGWRIAAIRPICTSLMVKIQHLPPHILNQKVYSYSLCVLEKETAADEAFPPARPVDALAEEMMAAETSS